MIFSLVLLLLNPLGYVSTATFSSWNDIQLAQTEITPQYVEDRLNESKGFLPNEPDSTINIVEELLLYEEVTANDSLYAKAKYVTGTAYFYKDFYNLSIESFQEVLSTTYAKKNQYFRVRVLNNLGVSNDNLRQHDEALNYYHQALEIEKESGDSESLDDLHINIGLVYFAIGDLDEALSNFNRAQELVEDLPVGFTHGLIQQNLGIVYHELGRAEESREATLKAIDIFEEHEVHRSKLQSLKNLAIHYIDNSGEYEKARTVISGAIEEAIEYDIPVQRALLTIELGRIEVLDKNPVPALAYFSSAEDIINDLDDPYSSYTLDLFKYKVEAFAMLGDTEGVMDMFGAYEEMREERNMADQTTAINELKLQLEVNENLAKMQEQTIELQEQRAQSTMLIYLTSVLGLLLVGALFFRKNRNDNLKKLFEVNQQVVKKHKRFHLLADREEGREGTPGRKEMPVRQVVGKKQGLAANQAGERQTAGSEGMVSRDEEEALRLASLTQHDNGETLAQRGNNGNGVTTGTSGEMQEEADQKEGDRDNGMPVKEEVEEKPERAERWIFKKVNDLVDEQSLYRDPNLSLTALSAKVGISARAVSESINYYSGLSYNHYINEFRVMDAMKDLEDVSQNHLNLEAIMEENGFASRSTFYSAFDKVTGMTPNQYRKISQRERKSG